MNSVPSSPARSLGDPEQDPYLWELLLSKDRDTLHMGIALVNACFGNIREVQKTGSFPYVSSSV